MGGSRKVRGGGAGSGSFRGKSPRPLVLEAEARPHLALQCGPSRTHPHASRLSFRDRVRAEPLIYKYTDQQCSWLGANTPWVGDLSKEKF